MTLKTPPTQLKHDITTDRAYVYYQGKKTYFGKFGSVEAAKGFAAWLREQFDCQPDSKPDDIQVAECISRFLSHAIVYYSEDGSPTGEYRNLLSSAQLLIDFDFAAMPASQFGPACLLRLQSTMAKTRTSRTDHTPKWARTTINAHIKRIRRIFRWCASRELIPTSIVVGLELVESIPANRNMARETMPVEPVAVADVLHTLPYLSPTVQEMIRVQLLCGMRPQDVCGLTASSIDTSGKIWLARPQKHKNSLRGKSLTKAIPPEAQGILKTRMRIYSTGPLFSTKESLEYWWSRSRNKHTKPKSSISLRRPFSSGSYGKAISSGIRRANEDGKKVPHWAPNQLRHLMGTHVRELCGLEAAQVYLGHAKPDMTLDYAQVTEQKLASIAARISSPLDKSPSQSSSSKR